MIEGEPARRGGPKQLMMHAVVVSESMFDNTHTVAQHVAKG